MAPPRTSRIAPIDPPDPEVFAERFVKPGVPVLLVGLAREWPARSRWTYRALGARFGDARVGCMPVVKGLSVHDPERGIHIERVRLGQAVGLLEAARASVTTPVEGELAGLLSDVVVPAYFDPGDFSSRLWLSPAGTATPLHRDFPENVLVQVRGRKEVVLFPPAQHDRMGAFPLGSAIPNFSARSAESIGAAGSMEVTLEAGDALYIPSRWWHQIRSVEDGVSINFWWAEGPYRVFAAAHHFARFMPEGAASVGRPRSLGALSPVFRRLCAAAERGLLEMERGAERVAEGCSGGTARSAARAGGALLRGARASVVAADVALHLARTEGVGEGWSWSSKGSEAIRPSSSIEGGTPADVRAPSR